MCIFLFKVRNLSQRCIYFHEIFVLSILTEVNILSFLCKNVQNETIVHNIILIFIQSFIISVVDLRRNFVAIDSFI